MQIDLKTFIGCYNGHYWFSPFSGHWMAYNLDGEKSFFYMEKEAKEFSQSHSK